jgi:transcriptional regulator PpsR
VTRNHHTPNLGALSELAPELAETLVSVASDIALVIDMDGRIVSIAQGGSAPVTSTPDEWVGKTWAETVTTDTRLKIEELLKEAASKGLSKSRQVNHPSQGGDIPLTYTAVRLGDSGPVLAVGRDMRALSALQQRLVETQQAMERDYWRKRRDEARYQLLFQIAFEAIVVIDAGSHRIIDANRAATQLLGTSVETLQNQPILEAFATSSGAVVDSLLRRRHDAGDFSEVEATLPAHHGQVRISLTPFGTDRTMLSMRLRRVEPATSFAELGDRLAALVNNMPDAIVVTDVEGRIRTCNPAFLELTQLAPGYPLSGQDLGTWLGRHPHEVGIIISFAKREGVARQVITVLRGQQGQTLNVELSTACVPYGQTEFLGFIIRDMSRGTTLPAA